MDHTLSVGFHGQLFFALCYLCSYYCLLPLWWTPWLRRLWPAGLCAWAMTVAVCSTSHIRPSKLPRFMSIDIHWCARQPILIIWSWGWRTEIWTPWQAGLVLLGLHLMFGTSDHATWCFWDIPFICCKNKLGIGISLDWPQIFQVMISINIGYTNNAKEKP